MCACSYTITIPSALHSYVNLSSLNKNVLSDPLALNSTISNWLADWLPNRSECKGGILGVWCTKGIESTIRNYAYNLIFLN